MSTQSRVLIILLITLHSSTAFSFFSSYMTKVEEIATTSSPRPGAMKLCGNNFDEALNMVCAMRRRRKRSTLNDFQDKCCSHGCTFAELNLICNPF